MVDVCECLVLGMGVKKVKAALGFCIISDVVGNQAAIIGVTVNVWV